MSAEQSAKDTDEMDAAMNRVIKVMPAVSAWRNKKRPYAKSGSIPCPICTKPLHLSQAGENGHVWGKCETEGCVSWME